MSQKEIKLSWRELNIAYNVDFKTVAELAELYGTDWTDMKAALRGYGFTVRKGEAKLVEPVKNYKVILIDTDKIVLEESLPSKTDTVATQGLVVDTTVPVTSVTPSSPVDSLTNN